MGECAVQRMGGVHGTFDSVFSLRCEVSGGDGVRV